MEEKPEIKDNYQVLAVLVLIIAACVALAFISRGW
jgi:hypothetical protein